MSSSTAELFQQALDLNEKDRAALAGLLLESLEEKPDLIYFLYDFANSNNLNNFSPQNGR